MRAEVQRVLRIDLGEKKGYVSKWGNPPIKHKKEMVLGPSALNQPKKEYLRTTKNPHAYIGCGSK